MSRYPDSLARRLVLTVTALVMAMWLLAALGAALVQQHELNEVLDNALRETAIRLALLPETQAVPLVASLHQGDDYLDYRLRDAQGTVLARSSNLEDSALDTPLRAGFFTTATHRVYTIPAGHDRFLQIGEPLSHRREGMLEALLLLLFPLVPAVPLCVGAVWWSVSRNLRPVLTLRQRIGVRGGNDMSPVPGHDLPLELRPVADSVSRLLERLQRVLEAERGFTANSAHELRTPVAAALAQVQRLAAELPEGTARGRIAGVEAALKRLARLSEKLLQLSRAEAGATGAADEATDMLPVLRLVMDEFRMAAGDARPVLLETKGMASLFLRMDPDGFAILMRNLIENALLHGAADAPVEILADQSGSLRVINRGSVVPAALLARLTQRFERGAATAPGSGLGLAIASSLAIQAGGVLNLYSPARGRMDGFEAVFTCPVPAPEAGLRP